MLDKAILIAAQVHLGQTDRVGQPYILHPLRVMMRCQTDIEKTVAALHDVVEDGPDWDLERLRAEGFSEEIVTAVDAVSRRDDESYEEFVERTALNDLGRRVKIADLEDNMDLQRIDNRPLSDKDQARLARYHKAWRRLTGLAD